MFAITNNVVDLVFCALVVVHVCGYVLYRHALHVRAHRTMGWSPTRRYLRMMRKEYNRYYRSSVHQ